MNYSIYDLLEMRSKRVLGEAYKLQGALAGMDVPFVGNMEFDQSEMSIVIPFASGHRRDGVGDLLEVGGIDTSRHKLNPVVLFDHGKVVALPVAQAEDPMTREYTVQIDPVEKTARAKAFFYQGKKPIHNEGYEPDKYFPTGQQEYDHALFCEQLYDMMVKRYIRAGSIGYQVIAARDLMPDYEKGTPKGLHLIKTLLLEVSAVVLPANQDTVAKALSLPRVCGKPMSPMLVKSLAPYAPPRKAIMGYEGKAKTPKQYPGDPPTLPGEGYNDSRNIGVGASTPNPNSVAGAETIVNLQRETNQIDDAERSRRMAEIQRQHHGIEEEEKNLPRQGRKANKRPTYRDVGATPRVSHGGPANEQADLDQPFDTPSGLYSRSSYIASDDPNTLAGHFAHTQEDGLDHMIARAEANDLAVGYRNDMDIGEQGPYVPRPHPRDRKRKSIDKLSGGLADDKQPQDFDLAQLKAGIKVEMEHTDDPRMAREIAMDHLSEDPAYYQKLSRMEGKKSVKDLRALYRGKSLARHVKYTPGQEQDDIGLTPDAMRQRRLEDYGNRQRLLNAAMERRNTPEIMNYRQTPKEVSDAEDNYQYRQERLAQNLANRQDRQDLLKDKISRDQINRNRRQELLDSKPQRDEAARTNRQNLLTQKEAEKQRANQLLNSRLDERQRAQELLISKPYRDAQKRPSQQVPSEPAREIQSPEPQYFPTPVRDRHARTLETSTAQNAPAREIQPPEPQYFPTRPRGRGRNAPMLDLTQSPAEEVRPPEPTHQTSNPRPNTGGKPPGNKSVKDLRSLYGSKALRKFVQSERISIPHGDLSKTNVPPARWKPGKGAIKSAEQEGEELSDFYKPKEPERKPAPVQPHKYYREYGEGTARRGRNAVIHAPKDVADTMSENLRDNYQIDSRYPRHLREVPESEVGNHEVYRVSPEEGQIIEDLRARNEEAGFIPKRSTPKKGIKSANDTEKGFHLFSGNTQRKIGKYTDRAFQSYHSGQISGDQLQQRLGRAREVLRAMHDADSQHRAKLEAQTDAQNQAAISGPTLRGSSKPSTKDIRALYSKKSKTSKPGYQQYVEQSNGNQPTRPPEKGKVREQYGNVQNQITEPEEDEFELNPGWDQLDFSDLEKSINTLRDMYKMSPDQ